MKKITNKIKQAMKGYTKLALLGLPLILAGCEIPGPGDVRLNKINDALFLKSYGNKVDTTYVSRIDTLNTREGDWGKLDFVIVEERRKDYVRSMKSIGSEGEAQISSINEVMAQYVKETIARTARNSWGLYVASEKIANAWQNRLGMNDYLGIEALSRDRRLAQVAMVDQMSVQDQQGVYVSFNPLHPNHKSKQQRFNGKS